MGVEVVISEYNGSDVCRMGVELSTFNGLDMIRVGSELVDFNGVDKNDGAWVRFKLCEITWLYPDDVYGVILELGKFIGADIGNVDGSELINDNGVGVDDMAKLLTVLDRRNVLDSDSCTSRVEVRMDEDNDIRVVANGWVWIKFDNISDELKLAVVETEFGKDDEEDNTAEESLIFGNKYIESGLMSRNPLGKIELARLTLLI